MSETASVTTTARAGRREWIGLVTLFLPTLLVSMDVSILLYAVPFVSADLEPSSAQLLWIMDAYGFVLSGALITMGVLGDRIGRRKLLMVGAAAFGAASVLTAYSQSPAMLIAARALLGLGGATLMPSTLALIRNMFHDAQQRATAIAIWTGATTGGIALGPILGGFMLNHFWWGAAFLVNVPVMALLLVLAPVLLPEFRDPEPGRFDITSSILSLAAILPIVYAIQDFAENGWEPVQGLAVAGVVFGVVFIRRQRSLSSPMIDLKLFKLPEFTGAIVVTSIAMFALLGIGLFTTQYLQLVLGLRPFTAALWSIPATLCVGGFAAAAANLAQAVRPAFVIKGGMLLAVLGCIGLVLVPAHGNLALLLVAAGMVSCGVVAGLTLTADLVVSAAPPARAGSASAVSETSNEFGAALGLAVLGSIGTAVYRSQMADQLPGARSSLGEAVAIAHSTPGPAGVHLLTEARTAFTTGLHAIAGAAGVVLLIVGVLAIVLLRHVPPIKPPAADARPDADARPAADAEPDADGADAQPAAERQLEAKAVG